MNEKKMKDPTWSAVKSALSQLRREELLGTIEDLYRLRKENQQFLHTRYKLNGSPLEEYKAQIAKGVNPTKNTQLSFKSARQALSDYKKATGDLEGLAELMVFYCENCAYFIKHFGIWEQYADATINIWCDTLKHIQKLPLAKHVQFWKRLEAASALLGNAGWGIDCIDDYMFEYAPDEDEIEATAAKNKTKEDMW